MSFKNLTLCAVFLFLAMNTYAQTGERDIKKQVNDSTKKEQSGKADVYVSGKPIFDPEAIQKGNAVAVKPIIKVTHKKKPIAKKRSKKKIINKKP